MMQRALHAIRIASPSVLLVSMLSGITQQLIAEPETDKNSADASSPNTVIVEGMRRDARPSAYPGRGQTLRPQSASGEDPGITLRQDSSARIPPSSVISGSGFVIPRLRGQDARRVEVWIGDILLQDPWSGLPIVDDLDLRAFGELEILHGLPPWSIASTSTAGVLRYRVVPGAATSEDTGSTSMIGVGVGRPQGSTGWFRQDGTFGGEEQPDNSFRIFGRIHQTDGKFSYYDDNGTPANTVDDRTVWRTNNDRRATQILPYLQTRFGGGVLTLLGWEKQSEQGLPTTGGAGGSARTSNATRLAHASWTKHLRSATESGVRSVTIGTGVHRDRRQTSDPERGILPGSDSRDYGISSNMINAATQLGLGALSGLASVDATQSRVRIAEGGQRTSTGTRAGVRSYGGLSLELADGLSLDLKLEDRQSRDEVSAATPRTTSTDDDSTRRRERTNGVGAAIDWRGNRGHAYVQLARSERAPTLLERFGDGARIGANNDLAEEATRHAEIGGESSEIADSGFKLRAAVFRSATENQVVFVPASARLVRATNLERAATDGVEAGITHTSARTELSLAATQLNPTTTIAGRRRKIPGVAGENVSASFAALTPFAAGQKRVPLTTRWTSNWTGPTWRDSENLTQVPGALVHDVTMDARMSLPRDVKLDLAMIATNVTNVRSVDIQPGSGRTGLSDIEGEPLPPRSWRVDAVVRF